MLYYNVTTPRLQQTLLHMQSAEAQQILDRLAIAASGVCVLHCLITPLLLVAIPALASMNVTEGTFHRLLLFLILPTSVAALSLGCRRHQDPIILVLGASGLLQLGVTALWGHDLLGETGEQISTVIGSAVLSSGHLRNYRLCRRAECH